MVLAAGLLAAGVWVVRWARDKNEIKICKKHSVWSQHEHVAHQLTVHFFFLYLYSLFFRMTKKWEGRVTFWHTCNYSPVGYHKIQVNFDPYAHALSVHVLYTSHVHHLQYIYIHTYRNVHSMCILTMSIYLYTKLCLISVHAEMVHTLTSLTSQHNILHNTE